MQIRFTAHAEQKFTALRRHGISIPKSHVIEALEKPDLIDYSRTPLLITQKHLDRSRVLRVVHRIESEMIVVITFYPGRKSQYEKEN